MRLSFAACVFVYCDEGGNVIDWTDEVYLSREFVETWARRLQMRLAVPAPTG